MQQEWSTVRGRSTCGMRTCAKYRFSRHSKPQAPHWQSSTPNLGFLRPRHTRAGEPSKILPQQATSTQRCTLPVYGAQAAACQRAPHGRAWRMARAASPGQLLRPGKCAGPCLRSGLTRTLPPVLSKLPASIGPVPSPYRDDAAGLSGTLVAQAR